MTFFPRPAAAALAMLSATPLAAECFTSADLARGLEVAFENGDRTTFRRMNDGYLQVVEYYADGAHPIEFRAHRGIYFVSENEIDSTGAPVAGTGLRIEFQTDPAMLPEPAAGESWEGPTVNVFEDGTTRNETTSVQFSDMPDVTLSDCTYDAVKADLRYDWGPDGGLTLSYIYLPQIGTAYIQSNQFDDGELNETTPVSLSRMSK